MPKVMDLDFRGAPPAQGGGSDRVPPGSYFLRVAKVSDPSNRSSTGKPMIVVSFRIARGDEQGKRIEDRFTMPAAPEDSLYGKQRFNAFLQCLGYQVPQDRPFRFDLDTLIGRTIVADISDNEMPATKDRPARMVSNVVAYEPVAQTAAKPADNGAAPATAQQTAEPVQAPPAPSQAAPAAVAPPPSGTVAAVEPPIAEPELEIPPAGIPMDEEPVAAPPSDDEFPFN